MLLLISVPLGFVVNEDIAKLYQVIRFPVRGYTSVEFLLFGEGQGRLVLAEGRFALYFVPGSLGEQPRCSGIGTLEGG
jgi:hypothetical protein